MGDKPVDLVDLARRQLIAFDLLYAAPGGTVKCGAGSQHYVHRDNPYSGQKEQSNLLTSPAGRRERPLVK